ncbi:hypothetical protein [Bradyrhizobium sp. S69]|uniref:hypothetical protein n=1 Tax=Bradyrhizobium sp. S69 TaxID=1641856 RepID=UPI00131E3DBB|nr:hypothetical protein [Bradyrhizobium sp. S69]
MKNFRFENIWLLSRQEQRARAVKFGRTNLIVGLNHTGKSTLIKSIFASLGATPKGSLAAWDKDAISLLEFSVDKKKFRALHQSGYRALFAEDGTLVAAASNHLGWTDAVSSVTGFNLILADKKGNSIAADSRCFFLPFYINQDGSWLSEWDTFTGLQQYKAPIQAVLEYFTGVKPPEWYEINSRKALVQKNLEELQREYRLVSQFRERFGKTISLSGPKIIPEVFEQDINRLAEEVSALNSEQERLRDLAVREQEALNSALLQVKLAVDTLSQYDSDASYLRTEPHETLTCPTCGAEHDKSFMEMLTYAEDARVLRELVVRLKEDAKLATAQYGKTRGRLSELEGRYHAVSEILNTRRGDLQFGDVVRSMGAEAAFEAFEVELAALKTKIDEALSQIEVFSGKLAELTSAKRTKEILSLFRGAYASAIVALNLPAIDTKKVRLGGRPNVSGSGGPRAILAYYSALWRASLGSYGSYSIPLVIDSPQQLGQDEENLPRMIKYIARELPESAQVILGIETPTEESFDQVIELDEPYHFLKVQDFDQVDKLLQPYVASMYSALLNASPGPN